MFQLLLINAKNINVFESVFKLSLSNEKQFPAYLYFHGYETRYNHRHQHESAER